jgi:hypothetical protein
MPAVKRNAAVLARYIRQTGMTWLNKRALKHSPHRAKLRGLREKRVLDDAIEHLVSAGWLFPTTSREGDSIGRFREDYWVNPVVHAGK